jgi:hypothetical protein
MKDSTRLGHHLMTKQSSLNPRISLRAERGSHHLGPKKTEVYGVIGGSSSPNPESNAERPPLMEI